MNSFLLIILSKIINFKRVLKKQKCNLAFKNAKIVLNAKKRNLRTNLEILSLKTISPKVDNLL